MPATPTPVESALDGPLASELLGIQAPVPPTPIASTNFPQSDTASSSSLKRKFSALASNPPGSTRSSGKRQNVGGAAALAQMENVLRSLSDTMQTSIRQISARQAEEGSPKLRIKAIERLKSQDAYLGVDRLVALIDDFNEVSSSVDTYLLLENDHELRHQWLNRRLKNFPPIFPPTEPPAPETQQ
jgi:hypothetical protein